MIAPITLSITTAGPVAAAVLVGECEFASAAGRDALDGGLRGAMAALGAAKASIGDVELVAVCTGPGSFTGLRIGVALCKSIAQARGLPLVGVSSYDVADFGAPAGAYPRVALVAGKRDYFYARVVDREGASPRFARGTGDELAGLRDGAHVYDLSNVAPLDQAVRVARVARRIGLGDASDWRRIAIDYGQRPNAEITWESRRGAANPGRR